MHRDVHDGHDKQDDWAANEVINRQTEYKNMKERTRINRALSCRTSADAARDPPSSQPSSCTPIRRFICVQISAGWAKWNRPVGL